MTHSLPCAVSVRGGTFHFRMELVPRLGSLWVLMHGPAGEAVSGAEITIRGNHHTVTDEKGRGVLEELSVGTHPVTVAHTDYIPFSSQVAVEEDLFTVLEVSLQKYVSKEN